jgi:hypothetical protein
MNDSVRGIGVAVAVGLVSGVLGSVAGWLSESREGPPPTPRTLQSSQPASQQGAADSGGRHQVDGDRESDWGAAASNRHLLDDRPPHLQQSAKEAIEASAAPSDSLEGRAASFVAAQVSGWSSANATNFASLANAYAEEIFLLREPQIPRSCSARQAAPFGAVARADLSRAAKNHRPVPRKCL